MSQREYISQIAYERIPPGEFRGLRGHSLPGESKRKRGTNHCLGDIRQLPAPSPVTRAPRPDCTDTRSAPSEASCPAAPGYCALVPPYSPRATAFLFVFGFVGEGPPVTEGDPPLRRRKLNDLSLVRVILRSGAENEAAAVAA